MSNLYVLLKNSFINNTGINSLTKGSKDNKENKKLFFTTLTIIIAGVVICGMSAMYSVAMATVLEPMGYLDLLPVVAVIVSCLINLFMSIYKAQGTLFSSKDYELLMSLPIKNSTILASKIISMLSVNYAGTACVLLPVGIVYYIFNGNLSWVYFITLIISLILIPLLPVVIASVCAVIITFISSRFKHKNIATTIIGMIFFVFVMLVSMNMNNFMNSFMENRDEIVASISRIYPPALYYKDALVNSDFISLLKLILISVIPFAIFIVVFSKTYKTINGKLSESYKKANYKVGELKANSQLKAILVQELRRYIATPIYVMNTAFGPVLLLIAAIATLFIDKNTFIEILGYPGMSDIIPVMVLGMFIFATGISCTTNSSISLEGNRLWIIKSLPLDAKTIFKGKILMNLLITVPAIVVSNIIITIGFKLDIKHLIINLIITIIFAVVSAMMGLLINLYFPKLDWSNPTTVVKQSTAVFITLVSTMILVGIGAGLFIIFKNNITIFFVAITIVLSILLVVSWNMLSNKGVEKFKEL